MVKISIIVPVYNTSNYLKECVGSLLLQTLDNLEFIFVDDGSTDNSLEILKSFKDKRIKILKQEHSGQSVARNLGLKHAKGEYIGFVDSDDWVKPNMFERLYSVKNDIVMGSFVDDDPYMSLKIFNGKKETCPDETFSFIFRICVSPCNKIYSRELLENIEFVPNLAYEDNLFFIQTYLKAKKVNIVDEPLYYYRKGHNSTIKNDKKRSDIIEIFKLMENYLQTTKYWQELRDYFYIHRKNTFNYWYEKITDEAIKKEFYSKMNV